MLTTTAIKTVANALLRQLLLNWSIHFLYFLTYTFQEWKQSAWVTQHPSVHHPKTPVLGFHGWDENVPQWSVYLVSSFFFLFFFFFVGGAHFFSSQAHFGFFFFSSCHLNLHFSFWRNSCLPAHLPPSFSHPSFVLVLSSITNTWNLVGLGFRVAEL